MGRYQSELSSLNPAASSLSSGSQSTNLTLFFVHARAIHWQEIYRDGKRVGHDVKLFREHVCGLLL